MTYRMPSALGIHRFGADQRPQADHEPGQYPKSGAGLSCRGLTRAPPHPQSAQQKGAEEHDDADEQLVQQAFGDDAYDAQHHRHDHQQQEEGNHPILRSVGRLSGGPSR